MAPAIRQNLEVKPGSFNRWALLVAAGIFATALAQPDNLDLPIRKILLEDLHLSRQEMSAFFGLAALAWYLKPLAGLLSDSVPIFGTRRRHYLMGSAAAAAALWVVAGFVPRTYLSLLVAMMLIQAMLVVASTVVGGILVEAGQQLGAEGRLVSVRIFVENTCTVVARPLGGVLALLPFSLAAVASGSVALIIVPIAYLLLRENATVKRDTTVLSEAWTDLRSVLQSRDAWLVAFVLFTVNVPLAFPTPLYFFQEKALGFSDQYIGLLGSVAGASGLVAAVLYNWLCRRWSLRRRLMLGILGGAAGTLCYVVYYSPAAAMLVEIAHGFLLGMTTLVLMEIAVLVTPRSAAAVGFALLMSAWNLGAFLGDYVSSALIDKSVLTFFELAAACAAAALLTIFLMLVIPKRLLDHQDDAHPDGSPGAAVGAANKDNGR